MQWEELKAIHQKWCDAVYESDMAESKRKRVFSEIFLRMDGAQETRKHKAQVHEAYVTAELDAVEKKSMANRARAELDLWDTRFRAWQSTQAMDRAKLEKGIYGTGQ